MFRRTRFVCLLAVFLFVILRALSHAHPTPPPWVLGVFDAEGLDDVLQGIRIPYARSSDALHDLPRGLGATTGRVAVLEDSLLRGTLLAVNRSRAPPLP